MARAAGLALGLGLLAGAAQADPSQTLATSRLRLDQVSVARMSPAPLAYASRVKPLPEGTVRTSVEGRFGHDETIGRAGLLCGLMPHPDIGGAQAAYGNDPDGKFIGAKLSRAF